MVLTTERKAALYGIIITVLGRQLDDIQCAADADSAMKSAMQVLARGSRDLAERWNSRAAIMQLPTKLLIRCFRYLDFNGRLTASAVFRHWRSASLSEPSLWSSFRVGHSLIARKVGDLDKLESLLQRSGTAPLSINLVLSPAHEHLLRPHMWRMKSLAFSYTRHPTEDFLCLPAPQLEEFVCRTRLCNIPRDFAGGMGRLTSLELINFSLPVSCPALETVRHFSGYPWCNDDLTQIFALCPRLTSLTIHGEGRALSTDLVVIFHDLPVSVRVLEIRRTGCSVLSYDEHFQHWQGHNFNSLFLEAVNDLLGPLQLFVQSHALPWGMSIVDLSFSLRTSAGEHEADILFDSINEFDPTSIPRMEHFLGRLVSLTLSARMFGHFVTQQSALHMPALTKFVLDLDAELNWRRAISNEFLARLPLWGPGLLVARLQSVAVIRRRSAELEESLLEWVFLELPDALRVWFHYDAPLLKLIEVVVNFDPGARDRFDSVRLKAMAETVLVCVS